MIYRLVLDISNEVTHPAQCSAYLLAGDCIGTAKAVLPRRSKDRAWHDRNVLLHQQSFGELEVREPRTPDRRERVESPLREVALQAEPV